MINIISSWLEAQSHEMNSKSKKEVALKKQNMLRTEAKSLKIEWTCSVRFQQTGKQSRVRV